MTYFIIALILTLISRLTMAYFLRKSALITDGDTMGHLTYVKEYYRTGGKPIDLTYLYILDGPDYPNGFHKLFYYLKIPVYWLEKYGGFLPAFFDSILLFFCFVAIELYGGEQYYWLLFFPVLRIFWGNESRAAHFSERAYGVLWGNIFLFSAAGFYLSGQWFWLLGALGAFTLASISSKFTRQAMTFFTVILSLLCLTPFLIGIYLLCGIAAFIITHGYVLKVLQGCIRHSLFYRNHLGPRNSTIRRNYAELLSYKHGIKRYIMTALTNSPLRIITDLPISLLIFSALASGLAFNFWVLWFLTGIILVLIISLKPLTFLGEPERYLEFSVIPAFTILSQISLTDHLPAVALAVLLTITILAYHTIWLVKSHLGRKNSQKEIHMISLRQYFKNLHGARVLTIPFRLSFFLGYENNSNIFITLFSNVGKDDNKKEYSWLLKDRYPFVRGDLPNVIEKYDLDYIVAHKELAASMDSHENKKYYDFSPYHIAYENDQYVVYQIKN